MDFPPCQLCGINPASCKAHIIPKQFYKRIRGEEANLLELHVEKTIKRRFTQNGIWEQGILCTNCDRKLGLLDAYAYGVLPKSIDEDRIVLVTDSVGFYEIGPINVEKFRQFLVALLWRASRASHDLFRSVKIPEYEKKFSDILTGKDNSWLPRIECVITHLKPPRFGRILLPPCQRKFQGLDVVQFYLYPWSLLINLEDPPFGPEFQESMLGSSGPKYVLVRNKFSKVELAMLEDVRQKKKLGTGTGKEKRNES